MTARRGGSVKLGKGWIRARLRRTAYNMMTLSFLTWCALLACYILNRQNIDIQFLTFTAAVIGIKRYINGKDTSANAQCPKGGADDENH